MSVTSGRHSFRLAVLLCDVLQCNRRLQLLDGLPCEVRGCPCPARRVSRQPTPASLALRGLCPAHASAVRAARRPMSRATALESGGGSGSALLLRLFESSFFDVHLAIG